MFYGGIPAIIAIIGLTVLLFIKSNILHNKKEKKEAKKEASAVIVAREVLESSLAEDLKTFFQSLSGTYKDIYSGLIDENLNKLKKAFKDSKEIEEQSTSIIVRMMQGAQFLTDIELHDDLGFGKAVSSIQDAAGSLRNIAKTAFDHIDNNHSGLSKNQREDFKQLRDFIIDQIDLASAKITKKDLAKLEDLQDKMKDFKKSIKKLDKNQIASIQKGSSKPRTNLLFLNILFKTEAISNNIVEIINFNRQLLKGKK